MASAEETQCRSIQVSYFIQMYCNKLRRAGKICIGYLILNIKYNPKRSVEYSHTLRCQFFAVFCYQTCSFTKY